MPEWNAAHNPEGTTLDEFRSLLEIRLQALQDATKAHGMGDPLPIPWRHGWRAYIKIRGRDRDRSLLAEIHCYGPKEKIPYVRRVRLVERRLFNLKYS